ncbi:MAG: acetate/propionate family kinase, partial [bacterium]
GHRVVHGGEEFIKPTLITPSVLNRLAKYNQLAPLHNPVNLACLKVCQQELRGVKNIAVFDTAFYQTVPDYIYLYALPLEYYQKYKIRRYGFHGLAHQSASEEAARTLNKKLNQLNLVTCHLGSGSSITAIKKGQALDTTMGFTPLEGLTMSSRAGDLDAMVPLYLMKELKMNLAEIIDLLNKQSGLLGIAGVKDMREVLSAAGYKIIGFKSRKKINKKSAKLALRMFVYDAQRYINSYLGLLGGADAIVFTGGIGERSSIIRQLIMNGIKWPVKIKTLVITADEELLIARRTIKHA